MVEDKKNTKNFTFKAKEYVVGNGFPVSHPPEKAGRQLVKNDSEKVAVVIKQVREGTASVHAALKKIESDKPQHVRDTNIERLRKKVRKALKEKAE